MGCARTIIPIRGGLTSQVTGLEDAANVSVPDTPGHLQRSCGEHDLAGRNCSDGIWSMFWLMCYCVP